MSRSIIINQIARLHKIYGSIEKTDNLWEKRKRVLELEQSLWAILNK